MFAQLPFKGDKTEEKVAVKFMVYLCQTGIILLFLKSRRSLISILSKLPLFWWMPWQIGIPINSKINLSVIR